MDLPSRVETETDDRLAVVIPTPDQAETITSIVKTMTAWMTQMADCAASGDLLRLLHLSNTLQENNSWLAGFIDQVMDCRF